MRTCNDKTSKAQSKVEVNQQYRKALKLPTKLADDIQNITNKSRARRPPNNPGISPKILKSDTQAGKTKARRPQTKSILLGCARHQMAVNDPGRNADVVHL